MRRLLILLLMLAVPLKAWASVALPHSAGSAHIGSLPAKPADAAHGHAELPPESGHHASCPGHDASVQANECPHLTMTMLIAAPTAQAGSAEAAELPAPSIRRLGSVILDVLLPPPLLPL